MQLAICSVGQMTAVQRLSTTSDLTALVDLAIFAKTVNLALGLGKNGWIMEKLKTILVNHRDALKGSHIREAFEKLDDGHPVRKLLVKASIRPYAEFRYTGTNISRPGSNSHSHSDSEADSESDRALNPAQRAAYCRTRFRFHSELKGCREYRTDLHDEYEDVWFSRDSRDKTYSPKHCCHITTLIDPLTGEDFDV